jgi:hypothetical protein
MAAGWIIARMSWEDVCEAYFLEMFPGTLYYACYLTDSMEQSPSSDILRLYGTRRFITVFTRTRH